MVTYNNEDQVNELLEKNVKVPREWDLPEYQAIFREGPLDKLVTLENMARPGEDPGATVGCPLFR